MIKTKATTRMVESLQACITLGEVLQFIDQVDHICITRIKGKVEFLRGDDAVKFASKNKKLSTDWRAEYALCSAQPSKGIVSFVVYPKRGEVRA